MGQTTVEEEDIKAEVENTCGKPVPPKLGGRPCAV